MVDRLDAAARDALAGELPGWSLAEDGTVLRRSFRFGDFVEAWGFMARVALLAQQADHHPDWSNSFSRVDITLTTHDAGGLTAADAALARAISALPGLPV